MTAAPARFTFDLDLGRNQDGAGFLSTAARSALLQQALMLVRTLTGAGG